MEKVKKIARNSLPWLTGAGLAASHTLLSSNCTVTKNGQCSTCGSCAVVLGTLVVWAIWKKESQCKQYDLIGTDGEHDTCGPSQH